MKQILIIIVLLLGSVSLAFAQESGGNKFKKYWNSLVNGNVDRTYEKKVDMSYAVAPCYTREGGVGIGVGATDYTVWIAEIPPCSRLTSL